MDSTVHQSTPSRNKLFPIVSVLFLLLWFWVWLNTWVSLPILQRSGWPNALLLISAVVSLMASASRQLPLQNVLLAMTITAVISSAAYVLNAFVQFPFGPLTHTEAAGFRSIPNVPPWSVPAIWIVVIFASRGTAQWILQSNRQDHFYGLAMLGLTLLLTLILALGLEPFATRVLHLWYWRPRESVFAWYWYRSPLISFAGWLGVATMILAVATPSLIRKQPGAAKPPLYPVAVWALLNILFATGAITQRLWGAAALTLLVTIECLLAGWRSPRRQ